MIVNDDDPPRESWDSDGQFVAITSHDQSVPSLSYRKAIQRQNACVGTLMFCAVVLGSSFVLYGFYFSPSNVNVPKHYEDGEKYVLNGTTYVMKEKFIEEGIYKKISQETNVSKEVSVEDGKMFEVIGNIMWHDKSHFTQGLTYSRGVLYESIGLNGKSKACQLNPDTGKIIKCVGIEDTYFAEGIQVYGEPGNEKLIQLTWLKKVGFIRDAISLEVESQFSFSTTKNEGWGICLDGTNNEFIVSDGSSFLHFWDVHTLEEKRRLKVKRQNGEAAKNLNELEFVNGKVLANIWYEDIIVAINPITGECENEYDFSMLWDKDERKRKGAGVLNGISVSNEVGVLYITGKNWDRIFKVKLNQFE